LWLTTLGNLKPSNISNKTFGSLNAINWQIESVSSLVGNLLGIKLNLTLKLRNKFFDLLIAAAKLFVGNLINLKDLLDSLRLLLNP
jgi:hypothetical protein